MADKASTWVRPGHQILCRLSPRAESVPGCRWSDRHVGVCVQCHQNIWQGEGNASPRVEPFNSQVDPHISSGVFYTEIGVVSFIMPLSPVGPRQPEDSPR